MRFSALEDLKKWQGSPDVDSSLYDEVFCGEADCKDLEVVFRMFNENPHPLHRGSTMSIGDVVEVITAPELVGRIRFYDSDDSFQEVDYTDRAKYNRTIAAAHEAGKTIQATRLSDHHIPTEESGFYFCDKYGFEKIDFDPSQTQKSDAVICGVMIEPGKPAYEAEIGNTLYLLQHAVGGYFECVSPFDDSTVLIANRDGVMKDLPPNREVNGQTILGSFIVVGDSGDGEFCSLTDEQTADMLERFAAPD